MCCVGGMVEESTPTTRKREPSDGFFFSPVRNPTRRGPKIPHPSAGPIGTHESLQKTYLLSPHPLIPQPPLGHRRRHRRRLLFATLPIAADHAQARAVPSSSPSPRFPCRRPRHIRVIPNPPPIIGPCCLLLRCSSLSIAIVQRHPVPLLLQIRAQAGYPSLDFGATHLDRADAGTAIIPKSFSSS